MAFLVATFLLWQFHAAPGWWIAFAVIIAVRVGMILRGNG